MRYVSVFACWLVAATFLLAALAKLRDLPSFAASITALGLASPRRSRPAAVGVVVAELGTAALCLVPSGTGALAGLVLATALLSAFTAVALSAQRGRRVVPCRCFGASGAPLGVWHAVRNAVMVVVALCGIWSLTDGGPSPPVAGWALIGLVSAVAASLIARADDLVELFQNSATHPAGR